MFTLSPIKLLLIVGVILILLGPDKLPEVASKLGSWWRTLKDLQTRVESEVRQAIPDLPSAGEIARVVRSPVNLLNQLADRVDQRELSNSSPPGSDEEEENLDDTDSDPLLMVDDQDHRAVLRSADDPLPPDPSLN